ncbi:hypothetical protein KCH_42070 [Kitasatospora cheerisanensis KCTC 2395]|uniref:Uncharacterized protein n=1 Tax=Kitasatospora cheerisanensis KCTC 2395 TaxID=1348663 RepID=A0A066Z239_9ACTN|nr:hypothetical protein KCH_42070 [Kitasatospora cheerisanensis KCTC 2395]
MADHAIGARSPASRKAAAPPTGPCAPDPLDPPRPPRTGRRCRARQPPDDPTFPPRR